MPLFQKSVEKNYLNKLDTALINQNTSSYKIISAMRPLRRISGMRRKSSFRRDFCVIFSFRFWDIRSIRNSILTVTLSNRKVSLSYIFSSHRITIGENSSYHYQIFSAHIVSQLNISLSLFHEESHLHI